MSPGARSLLLCFSLLAAVAVLFNGAFAAGAIPYDSDNILFYIPFFSLARLRPWALWDPFAFSGMPLLGNLQYAMFYPPRWIYCFADAAAVHGPFMFAHWLWAAWGAFLLARTLRLASWPALFTGITFAFGSHMQGRAINPSLFLSAAWLPWVVAAAAATLGTGSWRHATGLAVCAAMLAHAGSPHMLFFAVVAVMLLAAWMTFVVESSGRIPARRLVMLAPAAAVALMLFAPTLVHAILMLPHSVRSGASFSDVTHDPLLVSEVWRLWFGGLGTPEYGDKTSYTGMLALSALAAIVLASRARSRVMPFLRGPAGLGIGFAIIAILLALGANGGLYHILYQVPGLGFLIGPARALVLFNLGWALVTGVIVQQISGLSATGRLRSWHGMAVAGAGACALLLGAVLYGAPFLTHAISPGALPAQVVPIAVVGVFITLTGVALAAAPHLRPALFLPILLAVQTTDLFLFRERVHLRAADPALFEQPSTVPALHALLQPGERVLAFQSSRRYPMDLTDVRGREFLTPKLPDYYRIPEVQGYDPLMSNTYVSFIEAMAGRHPADDPYRTAHAARGDSLLGPASSARYVLGHPSAQRIPLRDGRAGFDTPTTISRVGLVSFLAGAHQIQHGVAVGHIRLELADGATTSLPIRAGIETSEATALAAPASHDLAMLNQQWETRVAGESELLSLANYYADIPVVPPQAVRSISVIPSGVASFHVVHLEAVLPEDSEAADRFVPVETGSIVPIFEDTWAAPPAYLATSIHAAKDTTATAALLSGLGRDIRGSAVLEPPVAAAAAPTSGTCIYTRPSPNRIAVRATTGGPGMVVVTESFDAGWRATVNGQPAQVFRANSVFIAVAVPSGGTHEIALTYRPATFFPSLVAAALGAILCGFMMTVRRRVS